VIESLQGAPVCLAVALVAIVGALAGCGPARPAIPESLRTPGIAGVVLDIEETPDGGETYSLENGQLAQIASQKTVLLGGEPLVGELLLSGTDPDGRQWVAGVSPWDAAGRPEGCFWLPSQGRLVSGWIDTTAGFRLPKAAGFDPGYARNNEFTSDRGGFCLNEAGEVTSYDVA
jgi:hypothetical protein